MPGTAPPPAAALQTARVSSSDLPTRGFSDALEAVMGRDVMGFDLRTPGGDSLDTFRFDGRYSILGSGAAYSHLAHTPLHYQRTPALMSDGLDELTLTASHSPHGGAVIGVGNTETAVPSGAVLLVSKTRAHEVVIPWDATTYTLQIPRTALAPLLPTLEEAPLHILTPGAPGADSAGLALAYAALVSEQGTLAGAPLAGAVHHLHELIASAIGAHHAAHLAPPPDDHPAHQAPRLALIQRSIHARLDQPGLGLDTIARLHHTTPRQVQRLFAAQGTCFSDYLADARLQRARALLASPAHRHRRVLDIALECGYDNISAFGRAFRRRFGITPSDVRDSG
ncbi:MAG: helix-turn-helix transcriptional regulator [Burkholderiaceae bacterium]